MRKLLFPLLVLLSLPAAAQFTEIPPITVGSETPVSAADRVPGLPFSAGPRVASDGENFLVTWLDMRATVYAARVSATGKVLDPDGFSISETAQRLAPPEFLLWTGREYVAAWDEGFRMALRRISRDGKPLDRVHYTPIDPRSPFGRPGAAATPDAILVERDSRTLTLLNATSLEVIRDIPLPAPFSIGANRWIASDGHGFLVASRGFTNGKSVFVAMPVAADGTAGAAVATEGDIAGAAAMVWDGRGYKAAYERPTAVEVATIAADGHVVSTALLNRLFSLGSVAVGRPPVGGMLFLQPSSAFALDTILLQDGPRTAGRSTVVEGASLIEADVAMNRSFVGLVVWDEKVANRPTLRASLINGGGTPADRLANDPGFAITQMASIQFNAAQSKNAGNWFAWMENDAAGNLAVVARDLTSDRPPVTLWKSALGKSRPSIATNGNTVVVVWTEGTNPPYALKKAELNTDGTNVEVSDLVADTSVSVDFPISNAPPSVAWSGFYYLVAWTGNRNQLLVAPMRPRASLLTDGFSVSGADVAQTRPVIVPGGETSLLVWQEGTHIAGTRLTIAGFPLDAPFAISPAAMEASRPDAAWNGTTWVAVWQAANKVHAARVTASAVVFPTLTFGDGFLPNVAAAGNDFIVAWAAGNSVNAARLVAAGPLALGPLSYAGSNPIELTTTRLANGSVLLLERREAPEAEFAGSYRIFYRRIDR